MWDRKERLVGSVMREGVGWEGEGEAFHVSIIGSQTPEERREE